MIQAQVLCQDSAPQKKKMVLDVNNVLRKSPRFSGDFFQKLCSAHSETLAAWAIVALGLSSEIALGYHISNQSARQKTPLHCHCRSGFMRAGIGIVLES
ncbi:MAG: hypothetical protein IPK58_01680 [Acidobacteria bacterium]|nr:hypothetical protein [Acidobacteriota bacterium]